MKKALFSFMAVLAVIGLVFAGCGGGGGGTSGTGGEGDEDGDDSVFTITFSDGMTGIDITKIDVGSLVDGVLEGSYVNAQNGWIIAFDLPSTLNLSEYDGIRFKWGNSHLEDGVVIVSTKDMLVVRISHESGMGIFGHSWYQPMDLKHGEDPTEFSFDDDFINWADSTSDAALAGASRLWFELIDKANDNTGFVVLGEDDLAFDESGEEWNDWFNDSDKAVIIPHTSTWYIYSIEFFKN